MNTSKWKRWAKSHPPCIWAWMVPGCKQADGSAKTREAKIVAIWTAEARDAEGKAVRDSGSITYSAAIESAATLDTSPELSPFAARVLREADRRGFSEAARCVVLGDGSPWIWNTATELFPQATQILDRFHAKEHLSKVGKAIYGDSTEGKQWIQSGMMNSMTAT